MKGMVLDAQNRQPVVGASISIEGVSLGTMADTSGHFRLPVEKKYPIVLAFSAIGYETQTRVIDNLTNWQDIQVLLKPAATELQEVIIISYPVTHCRYLTGSVVSISNCKLTKSEKITRAINDWVPAALKKDVKIYPNPVVRGNSINMSLALKQAGDYKLEVLNTAGQVMLVKPLIMQTKEQQVNLYTQTDWSAGVYWIRISAPNTKNVYQGKLLLQ